MHDGGPGRSEIAAEMNAMAGFERRISKKDSNRRRKSSKDSKKLQRDPERQRTYSFSPGRNDSIRVPRDVNRPPVPRIPSIIKRGGRFSSVKAESNVVDRERPIRASTQPAEEKQEWQRVPTLTKRKSTMKRKAEHEREEEIKAMLFSMPKRPATDAYLSGRPMKKDSKRMRDGLKRNLQNQSSDISLPSADSIHSSLSGDEQHASYKLSGLGILAPRPTIRYAENPHYIPGASGYGSDGSRKRKVSGRLSIPEDTLKKNKRVEELADNLDAGELRQLMERDQKRREKKKIAERLKAEQQIARRQEKQREEEDKALRNGTPPPVNMNRGVLGRDVVGLGIETGNSAVVTSNKRRGSDASSRGKRPAEAFRQDSTTSNAPSPDFQQSPSIRTPSMERPEPLIEIAKVGTIGRANISPSASPRTKNHTRGASSISQMIELSKAEASNDVVSPAPAHTEASKTLPIPIPAWKPSPSTEEQSSHKLGGSWTSFFKRNSKPKRGPTPPSSFSNTSRDSMQNGQGPTIGYTPMRSTSNVPKRTMSKFREHLPELPISPPDSRIQSPEADALPLNSDQAEIVADQVMSDPQIRYDTPTSGLRYRIHEETLTRHRSIVAPSPEPTAVMSQSLASIDSEGSWLSGRRGGSKRSSSNMPIQPLRESASSLEKRYIEHSESAEEEEVGIAEDEYFSRLTPGPEEEYRIHQRESNTMPSSDEEEGGSIASPASERSKWVIARTPEIHRAPRAKSREGLLNEYDEYDSDGDFAPPAKRKSFGFNRDLVDEEASDLKRATSIDLGKHHARRVSAGSARLLDLKKGSDVKRLSSS